VEQLEHRRLTLLSDRKGGCNLTWQSLSQIAWLHARPDWFVLYGIVVVAYAIYSLVTRFTESKSRRAVR